MVQLRNRVNNFNAVAILGISALVDGVQIFVTFIPFVGVIIAMMIGIFARLIFIVWFAVLNVPFINSTRRFVVTVATTIGEVLPFSSAVPLWVLSNAFIIWDVRMEDAQYNANLREEEALAVANAKKSNTN